MTGIQVAWEDVFSVLDLIKVPLILLLAGLAAWIAVMVLAKGQPKPRKGFIRLQSVIALLLFVGVMVNVICLGSLRNTLEVVLGDTGSIAPETAAKSREIVETVTGEGIVMLKNEADGLPLSGTSKLNVFGWGSTNPIYGGTGSGSVDASTAVDLLTGLTNAGFELNTELSDFYTAYRADRPAITINNGQDWTLPEPTADSYTDAMLANAREFSDTAVIVIARCGGEGADLPHDMGAVMDGSYNKGTKYTNASYTNNGSYDDFPAGTTYLELSQTEKNLVELVTANFDRVVVIYNGANPLEMGWVEDYPQIKSLLVCPGVGATGFNALGKVLKGEINPSGRTVDTWLYDQTAAPSYRNIGHFAYDNVEDVTSAAKAAWERADGVVSFVNYVESIYVGYRFYETAAAEGLIDYGSTVQYPFGYGLSYTTFDWEVTPVKAADSAITGSDTLEFDVKVTNTGDVAGKDVVQLYFTAPYGKETTNPVKLEKSYVVLGDFAKTGLLEPGASETVRLSVPVKDMASYDYTTDKTYVLDDGTYNVKISRNAHEVVDSFNYSVAAKELLDTAVTGNKITNQLDSVTDGYLEMTDKRLSRADFAGTMPTAAPETRELTEEEYAAWTYTLDDDPSDPWYTTEMPTQADAATRPAEAEVKLADLVGKDADDPLWDKLLDELTVEEMADLINNGGFHSINLDYIGKPYSHDTDGPKGWTGSGTDAANPFNQFAAEPVIAGTFNKDLLYRMGEMIGEQGLWGNSTQESGMAYRYTGWYAPGMNIHRSPFDSRYTEYYSEDPFLTGTMAAQASLGAQSKGCYVSIKHFAFHNDGGGTSYDPTAETFTIKGYRGAMSDSRNSGLSAWFDEQTAREIYLKGFQMAVEDGKATFAMSSFTRVGTEWCGGSYAINTAILRDEWGFQGAVVTDIVIYGFLNADQMIRAGGDFHLSAQPLPIQIGGEGGCEYNATQVTAMRNATKHILYMVANSNAMDLPGGAKVVYTMPTTKNDAGDEEEIKIPEAATGTAYETPVLTTATLNTYGAFAPITYAVEGLPAGLTLDLESGTIKGIPTEAGSFNVTVTASAEGYESASVTYAITVTGDSATNTPAPETPAESGGLSTGAIVAIVVVVVAAAAAVVYFVMKKKKQ